MRMSFEGKLAWSGRVCVCVCVDDRPKSGVFLFFKENRIDRQTATNQKTLFIFKPDIANKKYRNSKLGSSLAKQQ